MNLNDYRRTILMLSSCFGFALLTACSGQQVELLAQQLSPCPAAPHCVTSETSQSASAYVAPIAMNGLSAGAAKVVLRRAILEMGGEIQTETDQLLIARFSSKLFGFKDDLQCRMDTQAQVIHVRSASRLGYYDFGVNRRRVEALRQAFAALRDT